MKQTLLLVLSLFVFNFSTAQNSVDASDVAADSWVGWMNVTAPDGTGWGSGWGVADLVALDDDTAGTLTLMPNVNGCNDNPGDAYWAEGNLTMEANTYVEPGATFNGVDLTFSGYVSSNTFTEAHTGYVFIKALDPNGGWADAFGGSKIVALPESGAFEVSATADELATGLVIQYGFQVVGDNVCSDSTTDYGSVVITAAPVVTTPPNIFFSEYAEGTSNNKYLEIYNATDEAVDLTQFAFPSVSNDQGAANTYDFWNEFPEGASVAAGDVYVIGHPSADDAIAAESDHTFTYLSNGDDAFALVFGTADDYQMVDTVGQNFQDDDYADPGSAWDVAGVEDATKDHTLVRKSSVTSGNTDWAASAGTTAEDSEWVVLDLEDWTNLGSHVYGDSTGGGGSCDFTITLTDSYGDGWSGNSLDVVVDGTVVLDDISTSGASDTFTFEVSTGSMVSVIYDDSGTWDGENSYEVFDNLGNSIAQQSGGGGSSSSPGPADTTDLEVACGDPDAIALTATATTDGASATFSFDVSNFTVGASGDEGVDGHIHYSLNGGDTVMIYSSDDLTLTDLPNGTHTIVFELVDDAHASLDPAITATVEFTTFNGVPECGDTFTHTQVNSDSTSYTITAAEGEVVSVTVNGQVETSWDSVVITDSSGTQVNTQQDGLFEDAEFTADGTMTITITNDSSVNYGDLTFAVSCAAQTYSITFNVDPSSYANYTEGTSVVHLVGDFNGWNPGDPNLQMSDDDGDGIHSITLELADGDYTYKYTLGGWDSQEFWNCEKECIEINADGYWNRSLTVAGADQDLEFVHWNQCAGEDPAGNVTIYFEVNANHITVATTIYAGGGFLGDAMAVPLSDDDGDGIYTGSTEVAEGSGGNYIYLNSPANGGDWGAKEDLAGQECADPGNWNDRLIECIFEDVTLTACFGDCSGASCEPAEAIVAPWSEDFNQINDGSGWSLNMNQPGGWASWFAGETDAGSDIWNGWSLNPGLAPGGDTDAYTLYHDDDEPASGAVDNWIITPFLDCSQLTSPTLSFVEYQTFAETWYDFHGVYYSEDYDGTNKETATWVELQSGVAPIDVPTVVEHSIPATTTAIAWRYQGNYADNWFIDDVMVGEPLSTEDNNILDMTVYPNPVENGMVSILTPVDGEKFIELYSVTGRKVLETTIVGNTLDVSSITSGFYMLKVTVDGQSNVSKLVVR